MSRQRAFGVLEALSFLHSTIYLALLAAAVDLEPFVSVKNVLGWGHGVMWIGMSLLCIAALRARIISLWLCVAVVVIGGVGPFVGTVSFVLEQRRRRQKLDT
ncbi:MAG TPA: hypothetical protein VNT22_07275 [Baekduia sp.]|nr:hypothetical protein [Baekduia sp.]